MILLVFALLFVRVTLCILLVSFRLVGLRLCCTGMVAAVSLICLCCC